MTFKDSTLKLRAVIKSDKHFRSINRFLCPLPALRSQQSVCTVQRFHGVRRPSGDMWTREQTRRRTHTCFLDIIFIAISYWFGYRTGLHRLTWWNTVTLLPAGGHTKDKGGMHNHRKWQNSAPVTPTEVRGDLPPHRTSHCGETGSREREWDRGRETGAKGHAHISLLVTSSQSSAECSDWHFWIIVFLKKRQNHQDSETQEEGRGSVCDWWRPWEPNASAGVWRRRSRKQKSSRLKHIRLTCKTKLKLQVTL